MRLLFVLCSVLLIISSCASRETFNQGEQFKASYIFNKCYDVFSVKYPARKTEVLEFFINEYGVMKKKYDSKGSTLKKKLGKCFYRNAKRYRYTPSTREGKVSFRFKFGPAKRLN